MTAEAIPLYPEQIARLKSFAPAGIVDELIKEGEFIEVKEHDSKK